MIDQNKLAPALTALAMLTILVTAACGNGDSEPSREEVREIVRAELADEPTTQPGLTSAEVEKAIRKALEAAPQPEPGLSEAQVEEIVGTAIAAIPVPQPGISSADAEEAIRRAVAAIPQPEPSLTQAQVKQIVGSAIAAIPPRSAEADYTRFFVRNAITRYQTQGLDATLAYYNRPESVDGQWYVFIIDEDGMVIGHYDPLRLGLDLSGKVGTDANGYNFGAEMLTATEEGKWVSYVFRNPENGGVGTDFRDLELKNVWIVRHDGLLFASGWHIDADEFTRLLVSVAADRFRTGGLEATVEYFASPGSALAGLEAAIDYYNAAETVDGHWFAFIGNPDGNIVAHSNPALIGQETRDLFGGTTFETTEDGAWVTAESLRVYVAGYDGYVFGSGWRQDAHHDEPGS